MRVISSEELELVSGGANEDEHYARVKKRPGRWRPLGVNRQLYLWSIWWQFGIK